VLRLPAVALSVIIAIVATSGCCMSPFASRIPQHVDLSGFDALRLPTGLKSVLARLPRFEVANGSRARPDGIVEFLEQRTVHHSAEKSTSVYARVVTFATDQSADDFLTWYCEDGVHEDDVEIAWGSLDSGRWCTSPILQERGDPEGLCLPLDQYWSMVAIRKGNVLIMVTETGPDPAQRSTQSVLHEIASSLAHES